MFQIVRNTRTCHRRLFNLKQIIRQRTPACRSCTSKSHNIYLIDEDSIEKEHPITHSRCVNNFTYRTHTCGELRSSHIGQIVRLTGWLQYQRMNKFVLLRDAYGETQLLINDKDSATQKLLETIPLESILEIDGTVVPRPSDMINKNQATGEIEVHIANLRLINRANEILPFNIREFQKAKENLRMQYRYLDLRFPQMQRNFRVRSNVIMKMREFLINNHFVDVETPTLFKATPGGAQEFVVPTRFAGQFYSLVQSPQQFKQTLMAGGIDRYFQIARCYRDEGGRSDRQPEFTQLDLEIAFTTVEDVFKLIEQLLNSAWPQFLNPLPISFDRITYREAMDQYGSDQPDVRFGYKLIDCTGILRQNSKLVSCEEFGAYCVAFPKELSTFTKSVQEKFAALANTFRDVKFVQKKLGRVNDFTGKLGKLLSSQVACKLIEELKIGDESTVFLAYGNRNQVLSLLGKVRLEYANILENLGAQVRKKGLHFLWVVDFPLFELGESNQLKSVHHPFTAPHPDDFHLLEKDPLKVRSLAYDLVLNGNEVGGGSIRIHDSTLQRNILEKLRIDANSMQHFLDMLSSGCPPHGGLALGLDRLISFILNTSSIRDVIAFPKTFEGRDPFSGAPSAISEKDCKLYHIKSLKSSDLLQ